MATRGRHRNASKERYWRKMVSKQSSSGQTIRGWCRDQGINEATFHWWRRELLRRDAEEKSTGKVESQTHPDPSPAMLPVRIAPDEPSRLSIELPGGIRLHLTGPVDRQILSDVLGLLEIRPC